MVTTAQKHLDERQTGELFFLHLGTCAGLGVESRLDAAEEDEMAEQPTITPPPSWEARESDDAWRQSSEEDGKEGDGVTWLDARASLTVRRDVLVRRSLSHADMCTDSSVEPPKQSEDRKPDILG